MPNKDSDQRQTWRSLLGNIIDDRDERQRIAEVSGIRQNTLLAWAQGEADPHPHTLWALLSGVPVHRQRMIELIIEEFPGFIYSAPAEEASPGQSMWSTLRKGIPPAFYDRVLYSYSTTPPELQFWSICELVLQQALIQLDPERLGMVISVSVCMPPVQGNKVRCLWERVEVGTPPWQAYLDDRTAFLGAESLVGYAVTSGYPAVIQDLKTNPDHLPARPAENRGSAAAYPLLRAGLIAGCLLVSSTQVDYFTPTRLSLIESYSRLVLLAFNSEESYDRESIALGVMPSNEVQRSVPATVRQRVNALLIDGNTTPLQAERYVRQQIAEELLRHPQRGESEP